MITGHKTEAMFSDNITDERAAWIATWRRERRSTREFWRFSAEPSPNPHALA
jgi:hypothetical protein